jgi:exosortase/archaeosortase family protein
MFLRKDMNKALFVVLSLPVSIIKNGIRITTLTLLSIHVNPGFLTGKLHRDGGFVFFLAALALLWPVLIVLQKSERSKGPVQSTSDLKTRAGLGGATDAEGRKE